MKRLETNKYRKYQSLYYRAGVDFVPLAMEMHGAITDTFLKFLKKLASAAAKRNKVTSLIASCSLTGSVEYLLLSRSLMLR
jgi:hypothetical protein